MGRSVRPIRESWGPHSSYFVKKPVEVMRVLATELPAVVDRAARIGPNRIPRSLGLLRR